MNQIMNQINLFFNSIIDSIILLKKNIKYYFIPLNNITKEIDYYKIILYILISTFFVILKVIILSFIIKEYINKLKLQERCGVKKEENKCNFDKKCLLSELSLGTEIKTAIDKCLK